MTKTEQSPGCVTKPLHSRGQASKRSTSYERLSLAAISFVPEELVAAARTASEDILALAEDRPSTDRSSPLRLGLASYTFRTFSRVQMIRIMN
jgi:hypothetical protein